ncbi:hypothetical protein BDV95DRAFT_592913 [Massariosphaeria phaeospora]|uniref:C2H2-type domain-containing protein n=1 Tax=Massariosphaeria phaeospora TaxID=100035 RepID=A0A7C8IAT9_9PLEO|nr:hypothetical protein BDV95DRAFT_592913 [Massariosphaeria phaeospora]
MARPERLVSSSETAHASLSNNVAISKKPSTGPETAASIWTGPKSVPVCSRDIGGATVTFKNGVEVSMLSMPSDFSAVCLSNIPLGTTVQKICETLAIAGYMDLSPASIQLHHVPQTSNMSAQIKVADPDFARKLMQITKSTVDIYGKAIPITVSQQTAKSELGMNRLQLTSVSCSWHVPETEAEVRYDSGVTASKILTSIKSAQLDGRRVIFRELDHNYVKIGNLSDHTTTDALIHFLAPIGLPKSITWTRSPKNLEIRVKTSLEKCVTLVEWLVNPRSHGNEVKATAKFRDAEAARIAVKTLNHTFLDPIMVNLSVQSIISVKLSVSQRILEVVKPQLLGFNSLWATYRTNIKIYEDTGKAYNQLRIHGENKDDVARVKSRVERILAGHIAVDGVTILSNKFFFQGTSASAFLAKVMLSHDVTIVRDYQKMALRLYGTSAKVLAAQTDLVSKAATLEALSKAIVLDSTSLEVALRGGFRRVVAALGKDQVRMNMISVPKRILVNGTERQVAQVEEILREFAMELPTNEEEELCPVCWTPSTATAASAPCDAYKDVAERDKEFKKWKEENDVRDCPKCTTPIEKRDGCNHMMCKVCQIHICWFCMETFDVRSATYAHMSKAHGSWMD